MKTNTPLILSASPLSQPARKPRETATPSHRRPLYRGRRRHPTGKERDTETGLLYYGARYLDGRTGRWLSGDPAVGEYVPSAPVSDEARRRNGSLPGQGGVFNYVNLHVYHYAGNNPVRYVDPNGRDIYLTGQFSKVTLAFINQYSRSQYTIGSDGRLIPAGGDPNQSGSKTYSEAIDSIINNSSVKVTIMTSLAIRLPTGSTLYPGVYGEGATVPPEGTGLENEWLVAVSGRSNSALRDQNRGKLTKTPAEILIHEIVGHTLPQIQGRNDDNADTLENVVRGELNIPLVEVRPDHKAKTNSE